MRRPAWLPVSILALLAFAPAHGQPADEGLGVSPPRLDIPDAQAGETYVRAVSVQNQFDTPSTMTVEAEGEAGAWATVIPASGFAIPPRSAQEVRITLEVPAQAGPGSRDGLVRFTTEPKGAPSGSGAAVRYAVAVILNVTVGGTAVARSTWLDAGSSDTDTRSAPVGHARVRNDGNVRTTVRIAATIRPLAGGDAVASAEGRADVLPGDTGEVTVAFPGPLPAGQYVMRFESQDPPGFTREAEFTVAPPGVTPPRGRLLALLHPALAPTGAPVRIDGRFANEGAVAIAAARLRVEVRQGDAILAVLDSDPLVVPAGQGLNLTVYWTTPRAGTYSLSGVVFYDGYRTLEAQSILGVQGAPVRQESPWWLAWGALGLILLLLLAVLIFLLLKRRDEEEDRKGKPPSPPPPSRASPSAGRARVRAPAAGRPPQPPPPGEGGTPPS